MDVSDLLVLLAAFGGSTDGDTDADGDTDVTDLLNLLAAYGTASCGLLRPRILVVGGNDGAGDLATAELYDPSAEAWSAAASMATAREGNAVAAIGGLVFAMGGYTGPFPHGFYLDSAEVYDAAADAWSPIAAMGTARYASAAAAVGGRVYVTGGQTSGVSALTSAAVYDPGAAVPESPSPNAWSPIADLGTARSRHTAVTVGDSIYVMGGVTAGYAALSSAEVYAVGSNSWRAIQPMRTARYYHAAAVVGTKIYIVAGQGGSSAAFTTTEVYDTAAGAWSSVAAIGASRMFKPESCHGIAGTWFAFFQESHQLLRTGGGRDCWQTRRDGRLEPSGRRPCFHRGVRRRGGRVGGRCTDGHREEVDGGGGCGVMS